MPPPDALIVGVGIMDGTCRAIFTVDLPDIPDMVQNFVDNHRRLMDAFPGEVPGDPASLAHDVLVAATEEINAVPEGAIRHAAVYFLGTYGKPEDLEGPTMVVVDDDDVGIGPMDVRRILEAAGKPLH